jgi:hypothetical protein
MSNSKLVIDEYSSNLKEKINGLSQGFITPLKPVAKKSNAVMGAFNTSMAVFDGVLIGYKLLRKFRKLFK